MRNVLEAQPIEVAEHFEFVGLISDALRADEPEKLDPLPPEQREFALEVLRQFETEDEADSPARAHTDD